MKCSECGGLIIEYMHGELSPGDRARVEAHIETCADCMRELEEYAEIRRAVQTEPSIEPSQSVLDALSRAARDKAQPAGKPLWKKWNYSPILIPAVSTAIALSVWFFYGHQNFDMTRSDSVTTEVGAAKLNKSKEMREMAPTSGERDDMSDVHGGKGSSVKEYSAEAPGSTSEKMYHTADAPEERLEQETVEPSKTDMKNERELADSAKPDRHENTAVHTRAAISTVELQRKQLDTALTQQMQGDCRDSIETNRKLLDSEPGPPAEIKGASYLSLAECYEKLGNDEEAIANYINLQRVDPEQASFANNRIKEIRIRSEAGQGSDDSADSDESK